MKITVVIPVYKGEKTLGRAIDSVIKQTAFDQVELLLLDDCSPDSSHAVAEPYLKKYPNQIFYLKAETNLGISKNNSRGLRLAKGEYIARLDQDDQWIDPTKLAKQAEFLDKNPDHGLVGTWAKVTNMNGPDFEMKPPTTDGAIREKFLMASMFVSPSVMFRTSLRDKLGYYREDLIYGTEDYEYWLRIGTIAKLANLPIFALEYTFHAGSYSNQHKIKAVREHVSIIRQYRRQYPHYFKAWFKNFIQYNLMKIGFLNKFYQFLVPRVAKILYS